MNTSLKKPFQNGDKSQGRLKKLSQSYQIFQTEKIKLDTQIYSDHSQAFKNYQTQIKKLKEFIRGYKDKANKYLKDLKNKVSGFESQKSKYQKILNDFQKGVQHQNQQIKNLRSQYVDKIKLRINIAKQIDIPLLIKLDLQDRKSQSHQIFKWILLIFYKEPVSKYYWDNFKEQIYEEDKGLDFRQRLGKIPSNETKQQERLLTQKLLQKKQKIVNHEDFANVTSQVEKIFKIAQLYYQGYLASKTIKQKQLLVAKTKDERIQKEQMFNKAKNKRSQLQHRLEINQKYIQILQNIQTKLNQKQKTYDEILSESAKILQDLKNMEKGNFNPVNKNYFEEIQKHDNANCSIF